MACFDLKLKISIFILPRNKKIMMFSQVISQILMIWPFLTNCCTYIDESDLTIIHWTVSLKLQVLTFHQKIEATQSMQHLVEVLICFANVFQPWSSQCRLCLQQSRAPPQDVCTHVASKALSRTSTISHHGSVSDGCPSVLRFCPWRDLNSQPPDQ